MLDKQRSAALVFLTLLLVFVAGYSLSTRVDAYKKDLAPPSMNTGFAKGGPQLQYRLDGSAIHDVGRFWLQLTNLGIVGNPWYGVSQRLSAEWPPGSGNEYLYAAGLWIGGLDPRDRLPHVSTALYQTEFRPLLDPVWDIYSSYEGQGGGNRLGFFGADDDQDGVYNEDFLNGLDDDGDGEIDEDYEAISEKMYTCMYVDDTFEAISRFAEHVPYHILVRQSSYSWSASGVDEFAGIDFEIVNQWNRTIDSVWVGFMVDGDCGPKGTPDFWTDDHVSYTAFDTLVPVVPAASLSNPCDWDTVKVKLGYMWDAEDQPDLGFGAGDVPGYAGTMFLGHTTDPSGILGPPKVDLTAFRYFSGAAPYPQGDPDTDAQRYDLMSTLGIQNTLPGAQGPPRDFRYVVVAGPFVAFPPDSSIHLSVAFVVGHGFGGMRQNAVQAQIAYNGDWMDVDMDPSTGVAGMEKCLMQRDCPVDNIGDVPEPCGWTADTVCAFSSAGECSPEQGCQLVKGNEFCTWVDFDCNVCTGVDGKETQIHWIAVTPLPSPDTNIPCTDLPCDSLELVVAAPGDEKVVLQWNNFSEVFQNPIKKTWDFRGYRIWRAEKWRRPVGSISPEDSLWSLVADFSIDPADSSARFLGDITDSSIAPTSILNEKPLYPIGRYTFVDTRGVKNGHPYFYSITAYSTPPCTQGEDCPELHGRPLATEGLLVYPRPDAVSESGKVYVVPNPWTPDVLDTPWSFIPSTYDPTGTRISFMNLPRSECIIKIFTLAGDLVQTIHHDGSQGHGMATWNMISRNGQDVVAGIYLFSVESDFGTQVGKLVIVR
jgi:hypothetical protein